VHLVTSKCLPVLLYGLEACHLTKSDIRSMDFMFNRVLMRLFKTNKMEIILDCINYFNIKLPSSLLNYSTQDLKDSWQNTAFLKKNFCSLFAKT
jgi:pantothenate kinase